ncbi:hypothetical protein CTAYLR_000872 [Chrysophaeum taylorii]|uniref:Plastocyanin-like domain-containing protein n=1 Tax=Chrysophaeum taylorii TaxID=2483200 RepID=A0AAD7UPG0_9STRA|nr:hypothetical protein CTAYLR_000872 [Chrysophaeum taylorii]
MSEIPAECEWRLLAQDGMQAGPRPFGVLPLWPGARAGVLRRCGPGDHAWKGGADPTVIGTYAKPARFYLRDRSWRDRDLFVASPATGANHDSLTDVAALAQRTLHQQARPRYVADIEHAIARHSLNFDRHNRINGMSFDPGRILFAVRTRTPVEYELRGVAEHPIHFHAHPVQLIKPQNFPLATYDKNPAAGFMLPGGASACLFFSCLVV